MSNVTDTTYTPNASLVALARAAGAAGQSWVEWQCSDEVQAAVDAGTARGRDIHACELAFNEGVREYRLAGGWIIAWTTAPDDYDTFGTETIPAADGAPHEGEYHGKALRRIMMDPRHRNYQADRYASGLHATWTEDPRIVDAAAAKRAAKNKADQEAREAKRAAGLVWLTTLSALELDACFDDDAAHDHMSEQGVTSSDVRTEVARRAVVSNETTRQAEWARCLAIVPEGCTIVDHGCDAVRGQFGVIRGRPTHVYYNVRIVHGWPDDTEHANVLGEGAFHDSSPGSTNAGSLAYVADWLTKGEADGFTKKLEIVPVDSVPPRPVLERIGHEHLKDIRRVEAAGRVVWIGRPTFGETMVLDEKGHIVRAKKVLEAVHGLPGVGVNAERFAAFGVAYRAGLLAAVTEAQASPNPDKGYAYSPADAPKVADRMLAAIEKGGPGSVNLDGGGFRRACKALGIKHTRKAISAYLNGES